MSGAFLSICEIDPYFRSLDLTINEQDPTSSEQSQSLRRPLSAVPARLTSSQHVETTPDHRNDDGFRHDVPGGSSPVYSCLSPIRHFSLPEPFNEFSGSISAVGSPQKQSRSIEHGIRDGQQDVGSEVSSGSLTFVSTVSQLFFSESSCSHLKSPSVAKASSPLTGRRPAPGFGLSGAGNRPSSLHAKYVEDRCSLSDTETGSLYENAHVTAANRVTEENRTEGSPNAANQTWIGASYHEKKPHTRPISRDLVQPLPTRATTLLRPFRQLVAEVEEIDDRFVVVLVSVVVP